MSCDASCRMSNEYYTVLRSLETLSNVILADRSQKFFFIDRRNLHLNNRRS